VPDQGSRYQPEHFFKSQYSSCGEAARDHNLP
jgi:hypothetical protein